MYLSLVQERPCLWDSSDKTYKDKFIKQDAWKTICEIIYENYNEKDATEKSKLGKSFLLNNVVLVKERDRTWRRCYFPHAYTHLCLCERETNHSVAIFFSVL